MTRHNEVWRRVSVADVCSSIVDCVNKTAPTVDEPTPFKMIRTTNVRGGWVNLAEVRYVDTETYRNWTRRQKPERGDVILTREAPLGEVGMLRSDENVFLGQRLVAYRADPVKLDNRFLLYAMLSDDMQGQIKSMGSGATVEHMRVPDCEKLTLRLPSLPTQRRIASILSAYDDLIENNTRRMAILEEMARRIYEEWFVRFRFPGHENVRMVESELGALPEGWRHAALGSVADIQWGDTSKTKSSYSESGFDAYSASGLDGKMQTFDYERTGIVLSAIGARCGLTWFARGKWSCIKNTIRYWSLDQQVISDEFLYLATRDMAYWPRRGAAQPFISLGDAKKCSIVVSGDRLMSRFRDLSQPAMELVSVLSKMNRTLLSARDFLLPKLISGELDVSSLPKPEAAVA